MSRLNLRKEATAHSVVQLAVLYAGGLLKDTRSLLRAACWGTGSPVSVSNFRPPDAVRWLGEPG